MKKFLSFFLALPLVLVNWCQGQETVCDAIIDLGQRLELFVDLSLIESMSGTELLLHHPHDEGTILDLNAPWENGYANYATVLDDGNVKRLYYRANGAVTCCAESSNGLTWTKPGFALYTLNETTDNNAVFIGENIDHNFTPMIDHRPGVHPDQKYKALGGLGGLFALASPDGVHWQKMQETPVLTFPNRRGYMFDSQNVSFWSESEQKYIGYLRYTRDHQGPNEIRTVARVTSDDYIHWSDPSEMTFDDPQLENLYTNQTFPYYRAPHIYIATAARFMPHRRVVTQEEAKVLQVESNHLDDCSDSVLLTSRGGNHYDRTFREAFMRPEFGPGNWTSRTNYPAAGILQTSESEMSFYVVHNYQQPTISIHRYSLRIDGFISVHAPYESGEMITKPFRFSGKDLILNFATAAAGYVRVELLNAEGTPIPGFTLADSVEQIGNCIEKKILWSGDRHAGELAGQVVKLRFVMKEADLYSMTFRDE